MILVACDQSVRGFALAWTRTDWAGDWTQVETERFDGGSVSRGDEEGANARLWALWNNVLPTLRRADLVGFESYAFARKPDVHVVELVGALKLWLTQRGTSFQMVNQSSARKLLLAKVPRKGEDAKIAVKAAMTAAGAPANLSLDVTDALCVLNYMLSEQGSFCYGQTA